MSLEYMWQLTLALLRVGRYARMYMASKKAHRSTLNTERLGLVSYFTLALSSMRSIGHQPLSATRPTFGLSTCIYPRHSKFLISVPMSLLQLFLLPRGLHFRACRAMLVLSFRMVGLSDSISASQSVFPLVPLICSWTIGSAILC